MIEILTNDVDKLKEVAESLAYNLHIYTHLGNASDEDLAALLICNGLEVKVVNYED